MDLADVKGPVDERTLLEEHCRSLHQASVHHRGVQLVFIPENNLGLEASHQHIMMQKNTHYPNVIVMCEGKSEEKVGVYKSERITKEYAVTFNDRLLRDSILISNKFFCTRFSKGGAGAQLIELRKQLKTFRWMSRDAPDEFGQQKTVLTGKIGGANDDGAIVVQMLVYWSAVYMEKRELYERAAPKRHRYY